jgi:serine/threonine protein kinase
MPIADGLLTYTRNASVTDILECAWEIASTLTELHSRDISHRDIKPGNLYRFEGRAALGDFGLVALPDAEPLTTGVRALGPRHYIAPEMLRSPETAAGPPADIYSLAKTLWVLITGQIFPLPGQHRIDDASMTIGASVVDPRTPQIDLLIERSTANNAQERPSAEEFAAELRAILRDRPENLDLPDLTLLTQRFTTSVELARREHDRNAHLQRLAQESLERLMLGPKEIYDKLRMLGESVNYSTAGNPTVLDAVEPERWRTRPVAWSESGATCVLFQLPRRLPNGQTAGVTFWSGAGVELNYDGTLTLICGHVIYTAPHPARTLWIGKSAGAAGSAITDQQIDAMNAELLSSFEAAFSVFTDEVDRLSRE